MAIFKEGLGVPDLALARVHETPGSNEEASEARPARFYFCRRYDVPFVGALLTLPVYGPLGLAKPPKIPEGQFGKLLVPGHAQVPCEGFADLARGTDDRVLDWLERFYLTFSNRGRDTPWRSAWEVLALRGHLVPDNQSRILHVYLKVPGYWADREGLKFLADCMSDGETLLPGTDFRLRFEVLGTLDPRLS